MQPPLRRGLFVISFVRFYERELEGVIVIPPLPLVRATQVLTPIPYLDYELMIVYGLVLESQGFRCRIMRHGKCSDTVRVGPFIECELEVQNRGIVESAFGTDDAGSVRHDQRVRVDPQGFNGIHLGR